MKNKIFQEQGITLIALIITIIVMLILVGVTISVSLNGGLFETATKAATGTKKEAEKEQLLSAVVGAIGTDGKVDSTKISLPEGFQKDDSKSTGTKLVVKGKDTLWQIDLISAKVEPYRETYTFTIGELGEKKLLPTDASGMMTIPAASFWRDDASDQLKGSAIQKNELCKILNAKAYDITCSNSSYTNLVDKNTAEGGANSYWFLVSSDDSTIYFCLIDQNGSEINNDNYQPYADLAFTISMPE